MCAILETRHDLTQAAGHCQLAVDLDTKRVAADPSSPQAKEDLGFSLSQSGTIYSEKHDLSMALESHSRSLAIRQALAEADPKKIGQREALAPANERVASCVLSPSSATKTAANADAKSFQSMGPCCQRCYAPTTASGTMAVTPTSAGTFTYTLTCAAPTVPADLRDRCPRGDARPNRDASGGDCRHEWPSR